IVFSACDVSLPRPSLSCGKKGLDETPQCVKDEGRLKPPFAGNIDIPLAGARWLISRPRKANACTESNNRDRISNLTIYKYEKTLSIRARYTETPGGEKASARPRSALARGGSPVAPGKRSVFPRRVNAPTIISDYFAVYKFCVKNNN